MIEAYNLEGKKLSTWKNLHEYARAEHSERIHSGSSLSQRLNTIYVAAYMTIKNPGRYTFSHLYQENIMFKEAAKKIPTPNKAI
jgi:hypothetical protein